MPYPRRPWLLCRSRKMPLFSVDDGLAGSGHAPRMYGQSAYRPLISATSPSRNNRSPVASVRFPPPLSPATTIWPASTPSRPASAATQRTAETQSVKPAGNGATSGAEDGTTALRKSTIATATPQAAIMRAHTR